MDPTQVDARYQLQFGGGGGGMSYGGINPSVGPFTTAPLEFDQSTGFLLADGYAGLRLASLLQWGVIGTLGGQQLQGPLFLVGDPAALAPPTFSSFWGGVIQDGGLGFYGSADGSPADPLAYLLYTPAPFSDLLMYAEGQINLSGCNSVAGTVQMSNILGGSGLVLGDSGFDTALGGDVDVILETPDTNFIIGSTALGTDGNADLVSQTLTPAYFSIQGGAFIGQYGTDSIGNVFSGGICTSVGGGGGGVPWSSVTGTPTTLGGYGITDAVGVGDAAGGDLAGTYPNPTIGSLQSFPLLLSGPSVNDVLTWDGADIVFQAGGGGGGLAIGSPVTGGTAHRILFEDGAVNLADDANLTFDPASEFRTAFGGETFRINSSGVFITSGSVDLRLGYGTSAVFGVFGNILSWGTTGSTIAWFNSHVAPAATQAVVAPVSAYGAGAITDYLGTPDNWVLVSIAGTDYLIPAYLP